jgi:polyisoprenoid-binding protein YceI
MKMKVLAGAIAALATLPAVAAVETYTIDPRHTFPSFEVMHFGVSLQRGRFNKTTGKITVDTQAKQGTVEVAIDAASVDTGLDKLEEHVRAEDFLHASQFPTITFKGTRMAFDGDKLKSVAGELTMRGVTRPVTLEAQHFNCRIHPMNKKHMCGGEFVANIKRSEWGIKYAIPALADEMTLRINVEAYRD